MRILVTGASGFVGSLLVPRLLDAGHEVTAFGRDAGRVRTSLAGADVHVVQGDALSGAGPAGGAGGRRGRLLPDPLDGERQGRRQGGIDFATRERLCAENFAAAAARAGVRRIVYLGGLLPERTGGRSPSRHLASRHAVEGILLAGVPDSLALRASIVIGARSRSFRLLVHLVERMPLLTLPAWQRYRTQPIDARDVIEMLAARSRACSPPAAHWTSAARTSSPTER